MTLLQETGSTADNLLFLVERSESVRYVCFDGRNFSQRLREDIEAAICGGISTTNGSFAFCGLCHHAAYITAQIT
jgi:hypothetical protein